MLKIVFFLLILTSCSSNSNLFAQDSLYKKSISSEFIGDAYIVIDDFFSFYMEPFRFSSEEWLYTAGLTGSVLLMFTIDQNVTNSVGRNSVMTINNDFWDIPTFYGTIPFSAALSSVTYFTGLFINNESIKTTGMLMGEALLISGSAIFIIRYLTGRARPHYNEGAWKFHGFKIDREFQSFPSGHTNLAFVLSTVLAERLDGFWARLVLYGFAGLTAAAQVLNNQHFLSDVVVGGLFGFGTGMYVLNKEKNRVNDQRNSSIRFIPSQDGISLIITF